MLNVCQDFGLVSLTYKNYFPSSFSKWRWCLTEIRGEGWNSTLETERDSRKWRWIPCTSYSPTNFAFFLILLLDFSYLLSKERPSTQILGRYTSMPSAQTNISSFRNPLWKPTVEICMDDNIPYCAYNFIFPYL